MAISLKKSAPAKKSTVSKTASKPVASKKAAVKKSVVIKKTAKPAISVVAKKPVPAPKPKSVFTTSVSSNRLNIHHNDALVYTSTLARQDSLVSCGVKQVYGLPANNDLRNLRNACANEDEFQKVLQEGYLKLLKAIKGGTAAWLVLSNFKDYTNDKIHVCLKAICEKTTKGKTNPNSGNTIHVYIF